MTSIADKGREGYEARDHVRAGYVSDGANSTTHVRSEAKERDMQREQFSKT